MEVTWGWDTLSLDKFPSFCKEILMALAHKKSMQEWLTPEQWHRLPQLLHFENALQCQACIEWCTKAYRMRCAEPTMDTAAWAFNLQRKSSWYFNIRSTSSTSSIQERQECIPSVYFQAMAQVWEEMYPTLPVTGALEQQKQEVFGCPAPVRLKGITTRMHLEMGSARNVSGKASSRAIFNFELVDTTTSESTHEHISMEMTHEELYTFFLQLEKIQAQLDAIAPP